MKPELNAGRWFAGREELLVPVVVDQHLGQQRSAGVCEAGAGEAGVEHLDRDVLHTRAVPLEVVGDARRCLGSDEHQRDASRGQRADSPLRCACHGNLAKSESRLQGRGCQIQIVDGDHDVIDGVLATMSSPDRASPMVAGFSGAASGR